MDKKYSLTEMEDFEIDRYVMYLCRLFFQLVSLNFIDSFCIITGTGRFNRQIHFKHFSTVKSQNNLCKCNRTAKTLQKSFNRYFFALRSNYCYILCLFWFLVTNALLMKLLFTDKHFFVTPKL